MNIYILSIVLFFSFSSSYSQIVKGKVTCDNEAVPFANVIIHDKKIGTLTDSEGFFILENVPVGSRNLIVSALNMIEKEVLIEVGLDENYINIEMLPSIFDLDQVVLTRIIMIFLYFCFFSIST